MTGCCCWKIDPDFPPGTGRRTGTLTRRGSIVASPRTVKASNASGSAVSGTDLSGASRGIVQVQQPARSFAPAFRRAVHGPHVMDGEGAGGPGQGHRRGGVEAGRRRVDRADEPAAVMVVTDGSLVGARDDVQRTVVRLAVVEHHADGQHVVVGLGIEGPVLVPLDGGAARRPACSSAWSGRNGCSARSDRQRRRARSRTASGPRRPDAGGAAAVMRRTLGRSGAWPSSRSKTSSVALSERAFSRNASVTRRSSSSVPPSTTSSTTR